MRFLVLFSELFESQAKSRGAGVLTLNCEAHFSLRSDNAVQRAVFLSSAVIASEAKQSIVERSSAHRRGGNRGRRLASPPRRLLPLCKYSRPAPDPAQPAIDRSFRRLRAAPSTSRAWPHAPPPHKAPQPLCPKPARAMRRRRCAAPAHERATGARYCQARRH